MSDFCLRFDCGVRLRGGIGAIFATAAGFFSLLALFVCIPYATGYGVRPVSLFQNATVLWFGSSDWTHGIVVVPLAGLLVFLRRRKLRGFATNGSWLGLVVLLLSALAFWFGAVADLQYVGYLSLQGFLAGLLLWLLGARFFREIFLIWAFLTFAWPLVFLDQYLGFPLRLLMSAASAHLLNLVGIPTLKDGTAILSAPNPATGLLTGQRFSVDVADPCSGLHSLFALTMVSGFYAILTFRRWWQVLVVTLAALPLAIFGNLCRIVMLTVGALQFGNAFAIGSFDNPSWFHETAGILVYIAALSGVFAVASLLKIILRPRRPSRPREALFSPAGEYSRLDPSKQSSGPVHRIDIDDESEKSARNSAVNGSAENVGLLWRSIVVLAVAAGAGVTVVISDTFHHMGVAGVKMELPDSVGDALGFQGNLDREHRLLPADTEFAKKVYLDAAPTPINCEIVLSGAERSSIHRAEACLLGQGWIILNDREVNVALATGRTQKARLLSLTKVRDGQRLLGYFLYWYVGADRTTDDTLSRILLTSWDQLTRGVNHRWAYVTVNSELGPSQNGSEDAKLALLSRLIRFAGEIIPVIQKPETLTTANGHLLTRTERKSSPFYQK
jgi:exosortase